MKMKNWLAATALSLATVAASATPLSNITGNVTIKLTGLTTDTDGYAGTNESTWGLGAITQVLGTGGQSWTAGATDGTYLYFMLYGVADLTTTTTATGVTLYNYGATGGAADGLIHLDVYESSVDIPQLDSNYDANPDTRTGYNTDSLFAGLNPYLTMTFASGISTAQPLATMVQNVLSDSDPTSGNGTFLANVTGGSAAAQWNTNGEKGGADLSADFTLGANGASSGTGVCTDAQIAAGSCFPEFVNDPIKGVKVPEPASLALFGLGLAALAGLRRRKM